MVAVTKTLQDAAYVAVGLGVIGFQKAQVRRQELVKQIEGTAGTYRSKLDDTRKDLTTQVEAYRTKLGELADRFEPVVKNVARQVGRTSA